MAPKRLHFGTQIQEKQRRKTRLYKNVHFLSVTYGGDTNCHWKAKISADKEDVHTKAFFQRRRHLPPTGEWGELSAKSMMDRILKFRLMIILM